MVFLAKAKEYFLSPWKKLSCQYCTDLCLGAVTFFLWDLNRGNVSHWLGCHTKPRQPFVLFITPSLCSQTPKLSRSEWFPLRCFCVSSKVRAEGFPISSGHFSLLSIWKTCFCMVPGELGILFQARFSLVSISLFTNHSVFKQEQLNSQSEVWVHSSEVYQMKNRKDYFVSFLVGRSFSCFENSTITLF